MECKYHLGRDMAVEVDEKKCKSCGAVLASSPVRFVCKVRGCGRSVRIDGKTLAIENEGSYTR